MDRDRPLAAAPLPAANIWGGMYVASKQEFRLMLPLTLASLRIVLGAGVLCIAVRAIMPARSFDRSEWRRFAALAAWPTAALSTQLVGTDLTNASQGSLLAMLTPVFMLILGVTALGEHLTRRKSLGTALITVGALAVPSGQYDAAALASGSISGAALLLFPSLCFATFSVFAGLLIRRYSVLETVTYAMVLSVPLFGALVPVEFYLDSVAFGSISPSPSVAGAVFYPGLLSTAAAWYCWYEGTEYADANIVGVLSFAQLIAGILLGAVFPREPIGPELLGGDAVLAVGILLMNTS